MENEDKGADRGWENQSQFFAGGRRPNIASEMLGEDKKLRKLFLTLTHFLDINEANDFAICIHKCIKHGLDTKLQLFAMMILARVSVKGKRAGDMVDILTGLQMLDDKDANKERKRIRQSEKAPNV